MSRDISNNHSVSLETTLKKSPDKILAVFLLGMIFLTITVLYALLMFKDTIPAWGLILLAVGFLLLWLLPGRLSALPGLLSPVIGLLLLLPFSYAISIDRSLSLPKIYALILSIAFFFLILAAVRTKKMLLLALIAVLLLILATSLLGLLAANWSSAGFSFLTPILDRIPRLWHLFPNLISAPVVNVNAIGGALTFFVPLLVSLILDGGAFKRFFFLKKSNCYPLQTIYKIILIILLLLVLAVLVLSRSRGAWLGSVFGIYLLLLLKDRRFLWLIPLVIIIFILALFILADGNLEVFLALLDTDPEAQALSGRLQAWRTTLYMIQDFPLTGAGIGTYTRVFNDLYALNAFLSATTPSLHAHNTFLSVAVDLGIPALVLYLALLGGFTSMLVRTYQGARSFIKTLLLGLGCGMLAHQVFGLTDAFVLGTKLGIIFWIFLALASAIFKYRDSFESVSHPPHYMNYFKESISYQLQATSYELIAWLFVSFASLSFVNINIYLSLALAILGGFLLGILITRNDQPKSSQV